MIKLVTWEEWAFPDIVMEEEGQLTIEDCRWWSNLGVGDLIHHKQPEFGTMCYNVIRVVDPLPGLYPRGIKLVTIREAVL